MLNTGDSVTVIDATDQNPKTLGRTGTVVQNSNGLVAVKGLDNRIVELAVGERAYRPDQLRKN
ncbi:hypothetical protein [Kitasatospora sp. NPDC057223]|uniref:hypothetical protein n=1 Tax=Kitasatospora sp. NPDC057223 TaxID=3346055 RepID=UPI003632C4F9